MTLFLIAVAQAAAVRPERVILFMIIAAAGAALPLSAAWRELRRPRDAEPLTIDANYRKDDRFFATSFATKVSTTVGSAPRDPGPYAVVFRDAEVIDTLAGSYTVDRGREPESILDLHEDLVVAKGAHMPKEALVGRDATLRDGSSIRALKAERDVRVGRDVAIERWIDAGRSMHVRPGSDLGIRATALGAILLDRDVTFRFLAAPAIVVGDRVPAVEVPQLPEKHADLELGKRMRKRADGAVVIDDDFVMDRGTVYASNIIARGDVTLGEGATLIGSIHCDGSIVLEHESRVTGTIVAEHDITIGAGASVDDHAVAPGRAILKRGARVGTPHRVTTLLADEAIDLAWESIVYGRIVTYGTGHSSRS